MLPKSSNASEFDVIKLSDEFVGVGEIDLCGWRCSRSEQSVLNSPL